MSRIAILDPEVAAKIAAGEVIERPASVVKELVDNALDAGARRVSVEIEAGGAKQIRVTDDGCGMTEAEIGLSIERHATSKLRRVSDLDRIRTLGFRGEGLPSIAAIARLTLHSRSVDEQSGWRVRILDGSIVEREPMARRHGTTVTVDDLFYNTPGRGKFLKSTAAEAAHVTDVVSRIACVAHDVRLELAHNGRASLTLEAVPSRLQRVQALLGRRARQLVSATDERGDMKVEVCLTRDESMSTARQITLVVNERPVYDRLLLQAVTGAYGDLLAPGRFPMGAVFVSIAPDVIDVNIHPQKRQIRFRDPRVVSRAVRRCVEEALADSGQEPTAARVYQIERRGGGESDQDRQQRLQAASKRFWSAQLKPARAAGDAAAAYLPRPLTDGDSAIGGFGHLRVLGQVLGRYLVCERDDGLLLLDVDAARVRLTLAHLRSSLAERGRVAAQRLLIPATVDLTPHESCLVREHGDLIAQLGVELDPFGDTTWVIRAVPEPLQQVDPEVLLRGLLEALASVSERQRDGQLERLLLQLAARGARPDEPEDEHRANHLLRALDEAGLSIDRDVGTASVLRTGGRTVGEEPPVGVALPIELIARHFDPSSDR